MGGKNIRKEVIEFRCNNSKMEFRQVVEYAQKTFEAEKADKFVAAWNELEIATAQFKSDVDRIWSKDKYG